ncbi:2005_t:CDS:2, partial [Gigaspora margarita]
NMLKAIFGKEYFSEIHSSLNNIDHLRYLINKYQSKKKYPYKQDILSLVYNIRQGNNEFVDYLQEIVGDLDQGQAKHFGLCLEEIDNTKN